MALNPTTRPSNQMRNVLLVGMAIGAVAILLLSALFGGESENRAELESINNRLAAIETKLATPTPAPQASASPGSVTISALNKEGTGAVGRTVEVTGKVQSPHEGSGFILVDSDGTFLWIHTKDKIPTGTATVKGRIEELKDQVAQWKTEPGWPDNDTALTAKLREERIFIEAESVR